MSQAAPSAIAGRIILISGAPGAGKTTAAQALAQTSSHPAVHLATDSFYTAIKQGFVAPFLPEAAKQNAVVLRAVTEAMRAYASGGYEVVVDGIIGPWSLPVFVESAKQDSLELSLVVLRPSLEVTFARATAREGRVLKASGPIRGLYGALANLGALEAHAIDTTTEGVQETVTRIRSGVDAGQFVLSG